jgi:hypothetical protein
MKVDTYLFEAAKPIRGDVDIIASAFNDVAADGKLGELLTKLFISQRFAAIGRAVADPLRVITASDHVEIDSE